MQSFYHRVIMQIDHQIIVDICKQILITIINSRIRMNIRLVRVFQFFSQFNFDVRYKFEKNYIIFDALSKLTNSNFVI